MIDERMKDEINKQINAELYSAYLYLSMATYFEEQGLPGFANWMYVQNQEETFHGMKFFHYLAERGGRVELLAIDEPPREWASPLAVFEHVYEHEQHVTSLINNLVNVAEELKDRATFNELQWFVAEQVEEEANADAIVSKLRLTKDAPAALFMIDNELAARVFTPPAATSFRCTLKENLVSARIGIFYGSTTYGTQIVAEKLQAAFGPDVAEIHNITRTPADRLLDYPFLILGTSTWGDGDLQPAWNGFLPTLEALDLSGRRVAVYGLGDQETYPETFVSGLGLLYDAVLKTGADATAGWWPADGYRFTYSRAFREGRFVGLVIDKLNQAPLTNERVARWSSQLQEAWGL